MYLAISLLEYDCLEEIITEVSSSDHLVGTIWPIQAIHELHRRGGHFRLVTMCTGGGMGAAGVIERLN